MGNSQLRQHCYGFKDQQDTWQQKNPEIFHILNEERLIKTAVTVAIRRAGDVGSKINEAEASFSGPRLCDGVLIGRNLG